MLYLLVLSSLLSFTDLYFLFFSTVHLELRLKI